jgi:hypothetical protein
MNENIRQWLLDGMDTSSGQIALLGHSARATRMLPFLSKPRENTENYYGIEIEYEGASSSNIRKTIELVKGYAIVKRDGSLRNGLEICTAPATFNMHKDMLKTFFENRPTLLYRDTSTGMHVHLSQEPMSFLQLGKLYAFLNIEENNDFITEIAGRQGNNYCRRVDVNETNQFSWGVSHGISLSRYSRVNLANQDSLDLIKLLNNDKLDTKLKRFNELKGKEFSDTLTPQEKIEYEEVYKWVKIHI